MEYRGYCGSCREGTRGARERILKGGRAKQIDGLRDGGGLLDYPEVTGPAYYRLDTNGKVSLPAMSWPHTFDHPHRRQPCLAVTQTLGLFYADGASLRSIPRHDPYT